MVGHQAGGGDLTSELLFEVRQVLKIILKIIISGKDYLAVMSSLHDMVRCVG